MPSASRSAASKGGRAALPPEGQSRWKVWRWGQNSHRAKLKRRTAPEFRHTGTLVGRFVASLFPWTIREYPGHRAQLGAILALSPDYARRLLRRDDEMSDRVALRLADYLAAKIADLSALERDFREFAAAKALAKRPAGYKAVRMARAVAAKQKPPAVR